MLRIPLYVQRYINNQSAFLPDLCFIEICLTLTILLHVARFLIPKDWLPTSQLIIIIIGYLIIIFRSSKRGMHLTHYKPYISLTTLSEYYYYYLLKTLTLYISRNALHCDSIQSQDKIIMLLICHTIILRNSFCSQYSHHLRRGFHLQVRLGLTTHNDHINFTITNTAPQSLR